MWGHNTTYIYYSPRGRLPPAISQPLHFRSEFLVIRPLILVFFVSGPHPPLSIPRSREFHVTFAPSLAYHTLDMDELLVERTW